ncbi:MAG: MFS transporter [Candidatus Bathyarchaeota archaeon]|nr:MFS transporter [Candidatus Bathyarchaeota archaeon]
MQNQTNKTFNHYLLFWSGQITSTLGSSIVQFVIIWWITLQTQSGIYLSLAAFLGLMPVILLSPFAGVLIDRWNRKALIAIADSAQAIATFALIILFWLGLASVWSVLVILAVRGVCQAFHSPAVIAVTPSMVPVDKLSRINGLSFFFSGTVNLVGPVLAALLLSFWSLNQILWVDIATFAVAIAPLLAIKIPSVAQSNATHPSFKADFKRGFVHIKSHRGFLPLILLSMLLNLLITPLTTLLPYFIKFDHFGSVSDLALIEATFEGGILAGGLIMSMIVGFKRKALVMAVSFYAIFFGYLLFALAPTGFFLFMAVTSLMAAVCVPIVNVVVATIIQTVIPLDMQGRVNSVNLSLATAAAPIGIIASGVLVTFVATNVLFAVCAITGLVAVTLVWMFTDIRSVERMELPQQNLSV